MPYIIDTREVAAPPNQDHGVRAAVLSTFAVATLDEAQWAVAERIGDWHIAQEGMGAPGAFTPSERAEADAAIGKAGGSVRLGGLVVEVWRASWDALVGPENWGAGTTEADVVAAYNAENGPA